MNASTPNAGDLLVGAAAAVAVSGVAHAETPKGSQARFAAIKQVRAGPLDVGYAEAGPADGPAVLLLHGWPYDIHSYVEVAPILADAGYRVHRAAPARLRDDAVPLDRNAAQWTTRSAGRRRHRVHGCLEHQAGRRSADSIGAHEPPPSSRRSGPNAVKSLVSVSGYLIGSQKPRRRRFRPKRSCSGGISSISPPIADARATRNTGTISRS